MKTWTIGKTSRLNIETHQVIGDDCVSVSVISLVDFNILKNALDRIAILGSGEKAYTLDFTTEVNGIARAALQETES